MKKPKHEEDTAKDKSWIESKEGMLPGEEKLEKSAGVVGPTDDAHGDKNIRRRKRPLAHARPRVLLALAHMALRS
jgi:hypothetical protein